MYLRATSFSPIPAVDSDDIILIGPFESQEQLDAFLNEAGRVFISDAASIYSPDEYLKTAAERAAELERDFEAPSPTDMAVAS